MKFSRCRATGLWPLALLLLLPILPAQGLPLTVANQSGVPLLQHPVSIGVPIPESVGLTSTWQMGLVVNDQNGQQVPAQYKVLSRWHGLRNDLTKTMKWLLVSFPADLPANGSATYYLASGLNPAGEISVQDTGSTLSIQTMPGTSFTLNKNAFTLFDAVTVGGSPVVNSSTGGIDMRDVAGNPILPTAITTQVEEQGTVRVVVCQRGTLGSLNYTCRWYFHTGQSQVTVDFRLENHGAYGLFFGGTPPAATSWFDSLYLELPVNQAGQTVTTTQATRTLQGGSYDLSQGFSWGPDPLNVLAGFQYTETINGALTETGNRYPGALDVSGPQGGLTVAVDRFWQNFEKSFQVTGNLLRVGLWPEWGHGPEFRGQYGNPNGPTSQIDPLAVDHYRFEGGRWKTFRMVFDFHQGSRSPSQVMDLAAVTNSPPAGRPPALYVKTSRAVGVLFSELRPWNDFALRRYERMGDMVQDDSQATPQSTSNFGQIGLKVFRDRGGTYGGKQFYGWNMFGDIVWGEGASSLHYDWPLSMLLRWYRGGPYGYFDMGRDMVWHRRDYAQNHSTNPLEIWRGAQFYEKGWWQGNSFPGDQSHTWVHGVLLHYAITGDEGSREAALQTMQYLLRNTPRNWNGFGGARIPGWTICNLLDCYNYLGVAACLTEAAAGIANFQSLEQTYGGQGYVLNPFNQTGPFPISCKPWMHNIFFNAACRYTLISGDTSYVPLIQRMRNWFKTDVIQWAGGTFNSYQMPLIWGMWAPGYHINPSWHLAWPMLESLSYSALLFNSHEDFTWATGLFELLTRYHQQAVSNHVDLMSNADWSPISMRMLQYPGSESKIVGNYLRWGLAYEAVRTIFLGTFY